MTQPLSARALADLRGIQRALADGHIEYAKSLSLCLDDHLKCGFVPMQKCSENLDTAMYDEVAATAIGVLTALRYLPTDRDVTGEPMEDAVQSLLMEAMFRAPGLVEFLKESLA